MNTSKLKDKIDINDYHIIWGTNSWKLVYVVDIPEARNASNQLCSFVFYCSGF